jgi:hypothetical protein
MKTQKEDIEVLQNLLFLHDFITENKKAGKLTKEQSDKVESLWNKYKLSTVEPGTSIIQADFGTLGSLVIREVESTTFDKPLKYESGSHDYVSIIAPTTKRILWTDYSQTEPYNRQGGLYCSGSSFESLGFPVIEKPDYREFVATDKYPSHITFGVWGYRYNDFYGCVTFGICIKNELVDEFINLLRTIINK